MFILLLFLEVFLVYCSAQSPHQVAQKLCNTVNCPKGTSTACMYTTNTSIRCNGQLPPLDQNAIVDVHNSKRNQVALGQLPRFKPAVNMTTMQWSKELEQMAKYNVMRCTFSHDKCRNTNSFGQSGQNLYMIWGTNLNNANVNNLVKGGIESWFSENANADMNMINKFAETSPHTIGHFTAMIKYNSNFVGCSVNKYKEGKNTNFLLACNYASTNIIDYPIYIAGLTANKCLKGRNPKYPGLCRV